MKRFLIFFTLCLIFLMGCENDRLNIDTSSIDLSIEFHRMDRELFGGDKKDIPVLINDLKARYGDFYYEFMGGIMNLGTYSDSMAAMELSYFLYNSDMLDVNRSIEKTFSSTEVFEKELSEAFAHYNYYFPNDTIPNVVFFHTGYNVGIYPTDNYLGIGLEWYLGYENEIIQRLPVDLIPDFFKKRMDKKYLVVDAVKGFLTVKYYKELLERSFLDNMIHSGKIMYLTKAMLPDKPDADLMIYTNDQYNWMKNNEYLVWKKMVDDEVLFKKSQQNVVMYLQDGPFTNGFSKDSAPRAGVWVGWQMVNSYMDKHPELSLSELMDETDSRKILKYYKPDKS